MDMNWQSDSFYIDIPDSWERSSRDILEKGWRKILVIGATDRGKSTYCNFLIRYLTAHAYQVAFVDADIAQKDIGPPATISLGYFEPSIPKLRTRLASLYFIGSLNPVGHLLPMVIGTKRLVDAAKAPFIVIDTTGMIHGVGFTLKAYQVESIRPDIIVAIEKKNELRPITSSCRNYPIIRIRPSSTAVPKTMNQRKAARERAFLEYFSSGRAISLDMDDIIFQRSVLFNGRQCESEFLYCEKTPEGMVAVCEKEMEKKKGLRVIPSGFEKNLLCGLSDIDGNGLGIGIIKRIDFVQKRISVFTPVQKEGIRMIQMGDLYVGPDGRHRIAKWRRRL